MTESDPDCI